MSRSILTGVDTCQHEIKETIKPRLECKEDLSHPGILNIPCAYADTLIMFGLAALPCVQTRGHSVDILGADWCRGQENVDLFIHSPICLHGLVLN
jgi:hypothetical protein